jgi:MFS family permease
MTERAEFGRNSMQLREPRQSKYDYRWVILAVATVAQATASFVTQGLGILAGFLQQDFQLSNLQVGLLISVANAAPIVALPIVGDLLDRRSERLIVGTGAAILTTGVLLSVLGASFVWLLASLFIVGCGYSTTQPGGSKSVTAWFRGRQLGFAMGIRQAGLPLGAAAAAATLPVIASTWSWRAAFLIGAAAALGGALAFSVLYRQPAAASADTNRRNPPALGLASVLAMLGHPWMRGVALSGIALVSAQYAILTYFMLFLRDDHSIQLVDGAWLMFAAQSCGVAGRVTLGALSDRPGTSRFWFVIASMLAVGAGLLALALLHLQMSLWVWIFIAAWLGFFGLGWYGPWIAFIAEVSPPDRLGLALGTAMSLNQIAIVATPPVLGLLHDLTGSYFVVWGCVVALLAAAIWGARGTK